MKSNSSKKVDAIVHISGVIAQAREDGDQKSLREVCAAAIEGGDEALIATMAKMLKKSPVLSKIGDTETRDSAFETMIEHSHLIDEDHRQRLGKFFMSAVTMPDALIEEAVAEIEKMLEEEIGGKIVTRVIEGKVNDDNYVAMGGVLVCQKLFKAKSEGDIEGIIKEIERGIKMSTGATLIELGTAVLDALQDESESEKVGGLCDILRKSLKEDGANDVDKLFLPMAFPLMSDDTVLELASTVARIAFDKARGLGAIEEINEDLWEQLREGKVEVKVTSA